MLAETLRDWEEQKIDEGRQEGMQAGRREALAEERALLCSLAGQRFGADTGDELTALLDGVEDVAELARIGMLIIDCRSGPDFLARVRRC